MLEQVMRHVHNFFPTSKKAEGEFIIKDGTISLPFVSDDMYILIEGSVLNDGVYKYPVSGLHDEEFDGRITLLCPPLAFLDIVAQIETYVATAQPSAFQSESFGGYSYSRATNAGGGLADWQDVYRERLNAWRKI